MHYAAIPMKTVQLGFELENLHSPHFLAIQLFQGKYLGCYLAAVSLSEIYLWDKLTHGAQHIVRLHIHIIIRRFCFDVAPFIFKYATTLFGVEKNLAKEKVVHSYSINALSCLVIHSLTEPS